MPPEKIDHALVHNDITNNLEIIHIKKIAGFLKTPLHSKDFDKNIAYYSLDDNKRMNEIFVLEVGSKLSMDNAIKQLEETIISHAIVDFTTEQIIRVININDLQIDPKPKHKLQFYDKKIYQAKGISSDFSDVIIYALGSEEEMRTKCQSIENNSFALVYIIDQDIIRVVAVSAIEEYQVSPPKSLSDFNLEITYNYIEASEDRSMHVQVLQLGNFPNCAKLIDEYNKLTHALIMWKNRKNAKDIIPIADIKEFEDQYPEHSTDFDKYRPYSGLLTGSKRYAAIQIVSFGHPVILKFLKNNSTKRLKATKFSVSLIEACNHSASGSDQEKNSESSDSVLRSNNDEINHNKHRRKKYKKKNSRLIQRSSKEKEEFTRKKELFLKNNKQNPNTHQSPDSESEMLVEQIENINDNPELSQNSEIISSSNNRQSLAPLNAANIDFNGGHSSTLSTLTRGNNFQSRSLLPKNTSSKPRSHQRRYSRARNCSSEEENKCGQREGRSTQRVRKRLRKNQSVKASIFNGIIHDASSDSSTGSTEEYSMFERIKEVDNESKEIIYIHIGYNLKIPYQDWKDAKRDSTDDYSLVQKICRSLFGKDIVGIYLQKKSYIRVVEGRPRRPITEPEKKAITKCLRYFILHQAPELLKERPLRDIIHRKNIRKILSVELNHQFDKFQVEHFNLRFI
ncbi:uncharacterized protein LOC131675241 [Phymastichus coffea]|uniref:uncharacterized protein LOC131675241 n=1 Tax=Phymastichus coffea TaxID=108790 RepID=UPI00273C802F|nr:uncharacterized protein LOC131675241 [Phymastichus coffea]